MQHKFHSSSSPYSPPNRSNTAQKSQAFKSKPIFKQPKRNHNHTQTCSWSRYQRGVFARWLLRVVTRELIVQTSLYQNVSRLLQKSPKNVYNFHLKLLSQYRTNENIIASLLGQYFLIQKQAKLHKTLSYNNYDLNWDKLELAVPAEDNYLLETFLTAELDFMEAMCLTDKTPEGDFDNFYDIQISEYEMDGIQCSGVINLEKIESECY